MKYLEYLESEDWKLLRAAKLRLSGYACEACKKKTPHPHVHHVLYRVPIESGKIEDLRIMCEPCHNRWHTFLRRGHYILSGSVAERWAKTLAVLAPKHWRRKGRKSRPRFFREINTRPTERIAPGFKPPERKWATLSETERHELAMERANGF